jgi:D-glycero-beta-D-manno-heptose 1-phosphate adenylyltransferase
MSIINSRSDILYIRKKLKDENKKVVFTNGCFDILHAGHVDYLNKAKNLGDILIVGLNTDASVKRIKGKMRPIVPQEERATIIDNLKPVDFVTFFEEDTPKELIEDLVPDILVKGEDWDLEKIVGRDVVLKHGGEVRTIKFLSNQSTTKIINLILERYKD